MAVCYRRVSGSLKSLDHINQNATVGQTTTNYNQPPTAQLYCVDNKSRHGTSGSDGLTLPRHLASDNRSYMYSENMQVTCMRAVPDWLTAATVQTVVVRQCWQMIARTNCSAAASDAVCHYVSVVVTKSLTADVRLHCDIYEERLRAVSWQTFTNKELCCIYSAGILYEVYRRRGLGQSCLSIQKRWHHSNPFSSHLSVRVQSWASQSQSKAKLSS